jgi:hypothetical protein
LNDEVRNLIEYIHVKEELLLASHWLEYIPNLFEEIAEIELIEINLKLICLNFREVLQEN